MPLDAEQMDKVFDYLENNGIDVLRMVEPEKRTGCPSAVG